MDALACAATACAGPLDLPGSISGDVSGTGAPRADGGETSRCGARDARPGDPPPDVTAGSGRRALHGAEGGEPSTPHEATVSA